MKPIHILKVPSMPFLLKFKRSNPLAELKRLLW